MSANYAAPLARLKTLVAAATPASPALPVAASYVYPTDYTEIAVDALPVAMASARINSQNVMAKQARGLLHHQWEAEVLLLIREGEIFEDESAYLAERETLPWVDEITAVLANDLTLGGTVTYVGDGPSGARLLSYQIGMIGWHRRTFFGAVFIVPLAQKVSI